MKKQLFLFSFIALVCFINAEAQVLCTYCFRQNEPVSSPINNLITNGGFEMPACTTGSFCPVSSYYICDIPSWTCTGGGTSTYAQIIDSTGLAWYGSFISMVPEAGHAIYMGNFYANACSVAASDVSCLSFTDCTVSGVPPGYPTNTHEYGDTNGVSIEQTVSGLTPGNVYVLEFWSGGEYDAGCVNGIFAVDVGYGRMFLQDTMTNMGGTGIRYIIEFVAGSSSHTIKFTNWGHLSFGHTELVLDDVRLYRQSQLSKFVYHCSPTGVEGESTFSESEPVVYPNPSNGTFSVKVNSADKIHDWKLQLLDLAGLCVYQKKIEHCQLSTVNCQLNSGIYFVKVDLGKKSVTKKLIIQ